MRTPPTNSIPAAVHCNTPSGRWPPRTPKHFCAPWHANRNPKTIRSAAYAVGSNFLRTFIQFLSCAEIQAIDHSNTRYHQMSRHPPHPGATEKELRMKWLLISVISLAGLLLLIVLIGACLPQKHTVSRTI